MHTICFNKLKLWILPTKCICVFRMVLTINSDCFPKQHYPVGLCSGDVMHLLWGTNWILIYIIWKCICVFRMVLTINSACFPKQHYPVGLCSGDVMCFLWSTDWILIYIIWKCICVFRMVLTINRLFLQTTRTGWALWRRRNVFTVRYELNSYILFGSVSECSVWFSQ
jgi:hypothetical protein